MSEAAPQFEILARLGSGGMGEVYLATMRQDGEEQRVALKRLRSDSGPVSERYPYFEREAKVSALLLHPNIVRLIAWGIDDVGPYLALEVVEGRSASALLREYIRFQERLPELAALCIARDVARGLRYAHQQGVVHRDISPDNVLVAFDGRSKLTDFGVARVAGDLTLTSTGAVVGKYGYLAPELFEGHKASEQSDVFSFAATVYRLLAGVAAFAGRTDAELMRAVLSVESVPIEQHCDVPPEVARWLNQALHKDPAQRPSLEAGLEALEGALPGDGYEEVRACMDRAWPIEEERRRTDLMPSMQLEPPVATAKARPEKPRRSWWLPAMLASALALAIVTAAVVAGQTGEPGDVAARAGRARHAPPPPPPPPPPAQQSERGSPPPGVDSPPPPPAAPPARKPGKLLVLSFQHVRFFVDGTFAGETPMSSPLTLSAGVHDVRAVNENLAFDKRYRVNIEPSRTATVKVVIPQAP